EHTSVTGSIVNPNRIRVRRAFTKACDIELPVGAKHQSLRTVEVSYPADIVNKDIHEIQRVRLEPQHLSTGRRACSGREIRVAGDIKEAIWPDDYSAGAELLRQYRVGRNQCAEEFPVSGKSQDLTRST